MKNSPSRRQFHAIWRLLIAIPFLTAATLTASAATHSPAKPSVSTLVSRVDHHYNSIRSLEVQFVQTYNGMGMSKRQSGALLLKKPGLMRWTYTDPDGKLYILNLKYGYFYTPGQNQAQRIPAKNIDDIQSPLRFLLGHTRLERELSGLRIASQQSGNFTLQGTPRRMGKQITSLSLTVTPQGIIRQIRIVEADGVTNEFQFSGETDNVPAPASAFEFHPPNGVAIVDGSSPLQ
ncbi:MAG: outer membrane lipoprotein chaperone LolA [Acidobacteriaceae bacterium]